MAKPLALGDYLREAARQLAAAGVDNPAFDTKLLTGHALRLDRAQMLSAIAQPLSPAEIAACDALIGRRAAREPVARILGSREFWGLEFSLNTATLEPRPDSETLVHTVVEQVLDEDLPLRLLDLGTGSGCLLLALLHELPNATGLGIDCAPKAVEQARGNAVALGLAARAAFQTGDWLAGISGLFDIVVANPPYIPRGVIPTLEPEVYDFDPQAALDGGADGLSAYRSIIPALPRVLKDCGFAALEIGHDQAQPVKALMKQAGFTDIEVQRDLGGNDRCVCGIAPVD